MKFRSNLSSTGYNRLSVVIVFLLLLPHTFANGGGIKATCLYISPSGNDYWSGRLFESNPEQTDGPLKTLDAARDKIRQMKSSNAETGPIQVCLRGGDYFLDKPFELTAADSGTENAPVCYAACPGQAVRLTAGVPVTHFQNVANPEILGRFKKECRSHILQADLKALGITDLGTFSNRGFGRATKPAALELFCQGRPMTVSRWPNTGWALIDTVPNGTNGGQFTYTEDQPGTWAKSDDIWVHGFWTQDWADSYERVKSIDPAGRIIETYPPHGCYGYTEKHRYYVLNVLEELDSPGEWYLDRANSLLYFWPPEPISNDYPVVSIGENLLSLEACSHVIFRNMTFEYCRGTAIQIKGGTGNAIDNCTLRNIGNRGIRLSGGSDNGVKNCDIYNTGDGGVAISGGNVKTLEPGGLYADNNHIHHYNRWCLTYRPAVGISGVGNRIAHNCIHDGPHNAIQLGGNDHLVEYNEIYNVCTDSDDVGAFYSGRSWVDRGTIIRHNYFHHIHSAADRMRHGSRVVYLDDAASGFTIYGNVFYKAGSLCAVNVGGGRDNRIENNIFIDCKLGAHIDHRGLGWASDHISKGGGWRMYEKLEQVNYDQPPYSTRYPKLATILQEAPAEPRGNALINNLAVRTPMLKMPESHQHLLINTGNWSTDSDPGFVDAENGDFRFKTNSEIFNNIPGFKPIPFNTIGLRKSNSSKSNKNTSK